SAEEPIKEVLHIAGTLRSVIVAVGVVWLRKPLTAASAFIGGGLGQFLRVDVYDSRADLFDYLRKAVGEGHRGWNDERAGVGGIDVGLLFAADVARENRAGEDACRECREESERRGEAAAAYALKQSGRSVIWSVHQKILTSFVVRCFAPGLSARHEP